MKANTFLSMWTKAACVLAAVALAVAVAGIGGGNRTAAGGEEDDAPEYETRVQQMQYASMEMAINALAGMEQYVLGVDESLGVIVLRGPSDTVRQMQDIVRSIEGSLWMHVEDRQRNATTSAASYLSYAFGLDGSALGRRLGIESDGARALKEVLGEDLAAELMAELRAGHAAADFLGGLDTSQQPRPHEERLDLAFDLLYGGEAGGLMGWEPPDRLDAAIAELRAAFPYELYSKARTFRRSEILSYQDLQQHFSRLGFDSPSGVLAYNYEIEGVGISRRDGSRLAGERPGPRAGRVGALSLVLGGLQPRRRPSADSTGRPPFRAPRVAWHDRRRH